MSSNSVFEKTIRNSVKTAVKNIVDEEIEYAKQRVEDRTREIAAKLAIQISNHFRVETMQNQIVIEFLDRSKV